MVCILDEVQIYYLFNKYDHATTDIRPTLVPIHFGIVITNFLSLTRGFEKVRMILFTNFVRVLLVFVIRGRQVFLSVMPIRVCFMAKTYKFLKTFQKFIVLNTQTIVIGIFSKTNCFFYHFNQHQYYIKKKLKN